MRVRQGSALGRPGVWGEGSALGRLGVWGEGAGKDDVVEET